MTFNILIMVCAAAPYVVLRQPPGSEREGERERDGWHAPASNKKNAGISMCGKVSRGIAVRIEQKLHLFIFWLAVIARSPWPFQ